MLTALIIYNVHTRRSANTSILTCESEKLQRMFFMSPRSVLGGRIISGFCRCLSAFCGPRIDAPLPFLYGRGCRPCATESIFLSQGSRHSRVYGSPFKYSIGVCSRCFTTVLGIAKHCRTTSRDKAVDSFIVNWFPKRPQEIAMPITRSPSPLCINWRARWADEDGSVEGYHKL
jgi:hypothetical protein